MSESDIDLFQMSEDEYLAYKSGLVFEYVDIKRDGLLEWEELVKFPDNLEKHGKPEHATRIREVYRGVFKGINQFLGRRNLMQDLTKDDFIQGLAYLKQIGWFQKEALPVFREVYFDWIDSNNDGFISLTEWREYNHKRGMTDEEFVLSTFRKLDKNEDGKLDPTEMSEAIVQFNMGVDPNQDYSFLYKIKKQLNTIM